MNEMKRDSLRGGGSERMKGLIERESGYKMSGSSRSGFIARKVY